MQSNLCAFFQCFFWHFDEQYETILHFLHFFNRFSWLLTLHQPQYLILRYCIICFQLVEAHHSFFSISKEKNVFLHLFAFASFVTCACKSLLKIVEIHIYWCREFSLQKNPNFFFHTWVGQFSNARKCKKMQGNARKCKEMQGKCKQNARKCKNTQTVKLS